LNLLVQRDTFTDNSTTGELSINGVFECYTLEPRSDRSQGKPYCISSGTYVVVLQMSARFGVLTPHIQDVPDFTEIEIHPGNDPADTEGCTVVGQTRSTDWVGGSRAAFAVLMDVLNGANGEPITITYVGGPTA
jgi:hypothetical protein